MEIKYVDAPHDGNVYEFFDISKDRAEQLIHEVGKVYSKRNGLKSEDIRDMCDKCDSIEEVAVCCYMLGRRSATIYL